MLQKHYELPFMRWLWDEQCNYVFSVESGSTEILRPDLTVSVLFETSPFFCLPKIFSIMWQLVRLKLSSHRLWCTCEYETMCTDVEY